jgi:hypothetical protein
MFAAAVLCAFPLLTLAQPGHGQREHPPRLERSGWPPPQRMNPEERQRLREDVNSAREDYRGERMRRDESGSRLSPEERERLRRDVYDASRELRQR